jgi:hypothetical protein
MDEENLDVDKAELIAALFRPSKKELEILRKDALEKSN